MRQSLAYSAFSFAAVMLVPGIALADFCDILKNGHAAATRECRTNGVQAGAEFVGNWSILSMKSKQRSTGKVGLYTTGILPPYRYRMSNQVVGFRPGPYYLNSVCAFNQRETSISDAGYVYGFRTGDPAYVEFSVDGRKKVAERWPVTTEYALVAPADSKLPALLPGAKELSVYIVNRTYGGDVAHVNELHYQLAGYKDVYGKVCR